MSLLKLKPYIVGEYDIVAAENQEQALSVLKDSFDVCCSDDLTIDDVTDMSRPLFIHGYDEYGNKIGTLYSYVKSCNDNPSYLYGLE